MADCRFLGGYSQRKIRIDQTDGDDYAADDHQSAEPRRRLPRRFYGLTFLEFNYVVVHKDSGPAFSNTVGIRYFAVSCKGGC